MYLDEREYEGLPQRRRPEDEIRGQRAVGLRMGVGQGPEGCRAEAGAVVRGVWGCEPSCMVASMNWETPGRNITYSDPLTSALGLLTSRAERMFAFVVICCSSNRKLMHCFTSKPLKSNPVVSAFCVS